jgi:hypothetical protein
MYDDSSSVPIAKTRERIQAVSSIPSVKEIHVFTARKELLSLFSKAKVLRFHSLGEWDSFKGQMLEHIGAFGTKKWFKEHPQVPVPAHSQAPPVRFGDEPMQRNPYATADDLAIERAWGRRNNVLKKPALSRNDTCNHPREFWHHDKERGEMVCEIDGQIPHGF